MTDLADPGLFDSQEYEVPFPKADDKEVTDLVLRLAGTIKLNRNDSDHAALLESFRLGGVHALAVTVGVEGKSQTARENSVGTESVTHTVGLRILEIEDR